MAINLSGDAVSSPPSSGRGWPRFSVIAQAIILGAVSVTFAACGTSSSGPSGYLRSGSSHVLFVQITRNGKQLEGTLSGASISSSDPGKVQTFRYKFTGIASGSSVTLTVDSGLFETATVTGTVSGSTLVLSLPSGGGLLTNVRFHSASVGAYNHAVAALDKSAVATRRQEQKQAAAAARAKASEQADQAVAHANSVLTNELDTLVHDAVFKSELAAVNRALGQTQAALETTQKQAREVEALAQRHPNGDEGTVCADAEADVEADAQADVEADAQADVEAGAQADVKPQIQTVQGDIATVRHDLAALESAEADAPSYYHVGIENASKVQEIIAKAQASIQAAVSATNSDISKANRYLAAAYQAADQAIAAGHCGRGLGTPPKLAPISANSS